MKKHQWNVIQHVHMGVLARVMETVVGPVKVDVRGVITLVLVLVRMDVLLLAKERVLHRVGAVVGGTER